MRIEPTAPPLSRSAVRCVKHCFTTPFPKKEWSGRNLYYAPSTATRFFRQMLLPSLPNTAPPLDGVAPAAVPLAFATVLKPQHDFASRTPEEGTVYLAAATNVGKLQSIGTRRRLGSNLRHLRLAAQQSDALTTASQHHFQKRMVWSLYYASSTTTRFFRQILPPSLPNSKLMHCYVRKLVN